MARAQGNACSSESSSGSGILKAREARCKLLDLSLLARGLTLHPHSLGSPAKGSVKGSLEPVGLGLFLTALCQPSWAVIGTARVPDCHRACHRDEVPLCSVLSLLSGSPNCWKCRNVTDEIYLVRAENSELGAIAERLVAVSSMPGSGLWMGGDGGRKEARASPKVLRPPELWRGSTSSQGNRMLMCATPPRHVLAGSRKTSLR